MRNLIIKEMKEEIDNLLNTIYREYFLTDVDRIKLLYGDYNPENAKDLSLLQLRYITGNTIYKNTEEDLFEQLMYTLDNGKNVSIKQLVTLLPIYKVLINSDNNGLSLGALRSFMNIHYADDIRNFKNNKKNGQRVFSILDGFDHILGTKESFFDISSAALFLNYVDNKKDSILVPEYRDELLKHYNEIYSFLEFYTTPEFMSRFNDGEFELDTKIDVCRDNENLIKYFLNCDIPKYKNQYYTYKYLDDLVKLASDDKNAVMTRFTYSDLSLEDFENIRGIDITFDDIQDFIASYELTGNKFNSRQLEKLLINYRKNYLNNNYLLQTYNNEVQLILKEYVDYAKNNFAYTTSDFINYFNNKYNYEFECFSFDGTKSLLNYDILNEVVNNKSSLKEKIDSKSVAEYLDMEAIDELSEKRAKERVYNKYYGILTNYLSKKDVTLEYFIRENVSQNDEELFRQLLKWHCKNNGCDTNTDEAVKEKTAKLIVSEAMKEQEVNTLDSRDEIFEKYMKYLVDDKLEEYCSPTKLGKLLATAAKERIAGIEKDIIADIKLAITNNTNFYEIAAKYEILPKDLENIITKHFNDKSVKEKLKQERQEQIAANRGEALNRMKSQTKAKWRRIIDELLESNERIEEFCRQYNKTADEMITTSRIMDILRHSNYFDEEYRRYCIDKILGEKIGHRVIENKESIMFGIYNGVETCGGKRDYTLFDLFMEEGEPVRLDDVKYELLENNPYLDSDYPLKLRTFIRTSIERFGLLFPDNTQERVYNLEEAKKCDLIWSVGDSKRLITDEEKELAAKFIETMGFPKQMYFDALAAHVRGEYDLAGIMNSRQLKKTSNQ